jgi:hypothetical protein
MKHHAFRSPLDELYADLPDTRPLMRWPVFDDPFFAKKPVHWFDNYFDAVSFVNENLGTANYYIGEPRKALAELQPENAGKWL